MKFNKSGAYFVPISRCTRRAQANILSVWHANGDGEKKKKSKRLGENDRADRSLVSFMLLKPHNCCSRGEEGELVCALIGVSSLGPIEDISRGNFLSIFSEETGSAATDPGDQV